MSKPTEEFTMSDDDIDQRTTQALSAWNLLLNNWQKRARRNKHYFKILSYSGVSLSATTTLIAAIAGSPRWAVATASTLTTLATALLAATRAQDHWVSARTIESRLYKERFLFDQIAGPYSQLEQDQPTRLKLFAERISEVAVEGHNAWADTIRNITPPSTRSSMTGLPHSE